MQKGYERLTEPGGMKYNRRLKQGITKWEATQRLPSWRICWNTGDEGWMRPTCRRGS